MPFFSFTEPVRKAVYTTNAIESLNSCVRRAVVVRGHFPSDKAASQLIYMALRKVEQYREQGVASFCVPARPPPRALARQAPQLLQRAADLLLAGTSLRSTARQRGIHCQTLRHYQAGGRWPGLLADATLPEAAQLPARPPAAAAAHYREGEGQRTGVPVGTLAPAHPVAPISTRWRSGQSAGICWPGLLPQGPGSFRVRPTWPAPVPGPRSAWSGRPGCVAQRCGRMGSHAPAVTP